MMMEVVDSPSSPSQFSSTEQGRTLSFITDFLKYRCKPTIKSWLRFYGVQSQGWSSVLTPLLKKMCMLMHTAWLTKRKNLVLFVFLVFITSQFSYYNMFIRYYVAHDLFIFVMFFWFTCTCYTSYLKSYMHQFSFKYFLFLLSYFRGSQNNIGTKRKILFRKERANHPMESKIDQIGTRLEDDGRPAWWIRA